MKRVFSIVAVIGFLILNYQLLAQFSLSGELRPRMEYRHGYGALADSNARNGLFIQQRSRLIFNHKTQRFNLKVSLQDVRVWGSTPQLNTKDGLLSIHEAWTELILKKGWSLKFGRQEIIYDDHRIFGNVDWIQQARSHDAFLMKYRDDRWKLDVGFAYNQLTVQSATTLYATADTSGNYVVPGNYKSIQYFWVNHKFSDKLKVSALFLNNGLQVASLVGSAYWDNYSQTFGPRFMYGVKDGKFKLNTAFYYQMGVAGNVANSKISAYDIQLDASYKISDKVSLTLGAEVLSGNDQTDTSAAAVKEQNAFFPLYGTNHKFNGKMDYFYVGNHAGSVGLIDGFLKVKWAKNSGKNFIGVDIHQFMAGADVQDPAVSIPKAMNSALGMELDLSFGFEVSEAVTFKAGYSHFIGTSTMEVVRSQQGGLNPDKDELSNWAWAMITIKPNFIEGVRKK